MSKGELPKVTNVLANFQLISESYLSKNKTKKTFIDFFVQILDFYNIFLIETDNLPKGIILNPPFDDVLF